jgi:hypothetical protein
MVLLAVLLLTLQTSSNGGGVFSSYVNGLRWDFVVRAADLDKSPAWAESADSPPLAPRAAVRSARVLLNKLFNADADWEFSRVTLQIIAATGQRWVYLVDFDERPPLPPANARGATLGSFIGERMTVVVLMDGTAIVPTSHTLNR